MPGVNVETDHSDIQGAKSVADLQKLEIFKHLPAQQEKEANNELFTHVNLKAAESKPD